MPCTFTFVETVAEWLGLILTSPNKNLSETIICVSPFCLNYYNPKPNEFKAKRSVDIIIYISRIERFFLYYK